MCHEHHSHQNRHYPSGYREDEELYVYDQCCDNCCNPHCPMEFPMTREEYVDAFGTEPDDYDPEEEARTMEEVERSRREDAILRDEEPMWCIYWKGRPGCH